MLHLSHNTTLLPTSLFDKLTPVFFSCNLLPFLLYLGHNYKFTSLSYLSIIDSNSEETKNDLKVGDSSDFSFSAFETGLYESYLIELTKQALSYSSSSSLSNSKVSAEGGIFMRPTTNSNTNNFAGKLEKLDIYIEREDL